MGIATRASSHPSRTWFMKVTNSQKKMGRPKHVRNSPPKKLNPLKNMPRAMKKTMIRIRSARAPRDDSVLASHQEKKKPEPKGAPQISKTSLPRVTRRYSRWAENKPPSFQSTREVEASGILRGWSAASTDA